MDFIEDIQNGAVFVYPTDTIYGLGCDAGNSGSVALIRRIKYKDVDKPMSVIAPSIDWILEHCVVERDLLKKYLPGPYTLILKKKDPGFLIDASTNENLGVRIPDSEFAELVEKAGVPFLTTSVNLVGESFAIKISEISPKILDMVDIIIGVGKLDGRPSTIVVEGKEIKR